MSPRIYRRVYIEVVSREDLTTQQSIDNLTFQLCEGLVHETALVQLHVVDRSESLAKIASGEDLISEAHRLVMPAKTSSWNAGHTACLHLACTALSSPQVQQEFR
jgi:hypothetical protein